MLETRTVSPVEIRRRRKCDGNASHLFTTYEVYDSVAKGIGATWDKKVAESLRGFDSRKQRHAIRQTIQQGLQNTDKYEVIALIAGCSVSLVEKVAKEIRGRT